MSSKNNKPAAGDRRVRVRGIRRDPPDIKKLSRALIALAMAQAQAEADAQQAHDTATKENGRSRTSNRRPTADEEKIA